MRLFKQLCCKQLLMPSVSGNSEVDLSVVLATLTAATDNKSHGASSSINKPPTPLAVSCTFPTDMTRACLEENGLYYVCGYLLRKLLKLHKCVECDLLLHEIEPAYDSTTTYLRQRSFSENLRGGLISVSPCFHDYIVQCERVFVAVFESSGHEPKIGSKVVAHLSEIPSPVSCESFPKTKFLRFFTRIRIYYTFKFRNRQLKQKPAAKKRNKKLTKLQHQ